MHSSFVIKETEAYNFDADWTRGKHEADCRVVFCAALRKDHLLIVVGRGKVRLEHDIVEQLLAGCEQGIDLCTPGIMLGLQLCAPPTFSDEFLALL